MKIIVSDIQIEIQRKKIKHLYLYVKQPYGRVVISAPKTMEMKSIESFIKKKLGWIKKQICKFENSNKILSKKQYILGEYIWGQEYHLEFKETKYSNLFEIKGNKIILSMKVETGIEHREAYVRKQLRLMLAEEIKKLLPNWEAITGLKCDSWQIKHMISRWGTCNVDKKKLWFNLQLIQRQKICLEYVILHELLHFIERGHNTVFYFHIDKYMPNWRDVKNVLNNI